VTVINHPTVKPEDFSMNYFTLDIEAYPDEKGNFIPYMLGIYSEELGYQSFYGTNCLSEAVKFILNHNYDSSSVTFYAHNGSKFDFLFLIRELNSNGIDSIRMLKDKQNGIFYIEFEFNGVKFIMKDSFKLMPLGLDKLLKDFSIDVNGSIGKLPLDHNWVNAANLYYTGPTPSWLSHIEGDLISMGVITNGEFSFQRNCEVYNRIDCIGLHKLIYKFFQTLVSEFKIDFSFCISLPQIAMELFRSVYLKSNKLIRLLSDRHYKFIKQAYYGSNVSVYVPYAEGKIYAYDINSLYPYCMMKDIPVGTPRPYDVSKGLQDFYGFALAECTCPPDLKIPVLPYKANINGSDKLIFPTGTYRSVYYSEELKYAQSLGYSIKLIHGYSFERSKDLFHGFVQNFYHKKSTGTGVKKAISKLLLNSLYGRFAMRREYESSFITSSDTTKEQILNLFTNIQAEPLSNKSVLFNFSVSPNSNLENPYVVDLLNKLFNMDLENRVSNIAIAAAITAYARIEIDDKGESNELENGSLFENIRCDQYNLNKLIRALIHF
jgi:hypothetical protein